MAEGRSKDAWSRTAAILSMLANANRDPQKRRQPFRPSDFNPYERQKTSAPAATITAANFDLLRTVFMEPITKGQ